MEGREEIGVRPGSFAQLLSAVLSFWAVAWVARIIVSSDRVFRSVTPFVVAGLAGYATSSDGWGPRQVAHLGGQSQEGDSLGQMWLDCASGCQAPGHLS